MILLPLYSALWGFRSARLVASQLYFIAFGNVFWNPKKNITRWIKNQFQKVFFIFIIRSAAIRSVVSVAGEYTWLGFFYIVIAGSNRIILRGWKPRRALCEAFSACCTTNILLVKLWLSVHCDSIHVLSIGGGFLKPWLSAHCNSIHVLSMC